MPPSNLSRRTVRGSIFNRDGSAAEGTLTFRRTVLLESAAGAEYILPGTDMVEIGADGSFAIDLIASGNSNWTPLSWSYTVAVRTKEYQRFFPLEVPVGGDDFLLDIPEESLPLPDNADLYVAKASVGQVGGPAGPLDANGLVPTSQLPVAGGAEPAIPAGTTAQYYRGDKTWATLNKAAVGLGQADNTSDADKPVSTATQAALDGKMPVVMVDNGSGYVPDNQIRIYIGATDPNLSTDYIWINTGA